VGEGSDIVEKQTPVDVAVGSEAKPILLRHGRRLLLAADEHRHLRPRVVDRGGDDVVERREACAGRRVVEQREVLAVSVAVADEIVDRNARRNAVTSLAGAALTSRSAATTR